MPLTANKQRQASGTSDFDELLNIIEEDEKPRKKSSKGASSRSSAKGSSSSSKDKAAKSKKSSSRKTSSTSSRVSKSSLSSKTGSRSSDEEVVLSSDDLADVDIVHDSAHARSRTAAHVRPSAASAGSGRGPGLDPLAPMREAQEGSEAAAPKSAQHASVGAESQVLSFFRDDSKSSAGGADVGQDPESADLSDILGVSRKPSRLGRRRGDAPAHAATGEQADEGAVASQRQMRALAVAEEEEEEEAEEEGPGAAAAAPAPAPPSAARRPSEQLGAVGSPEWSKSSRAQSQAASAGTRADSPGGNVAGGAAGAAGDSPPLQARLQNLSPKLEPLGRSPSSKRDASHPTPLRAASPAVGNDSVTSLTSVNFDESADADEVRCCLCCSNRGVSHRCSASCSTLRRTCYSNSGVSRRCCASWSKVPRPVRDRRRPCPRARQAPGPRQRPTSQPTQPLASPARAVARCWGPPTARAAAAGAAAGRCRCWAAQARRRTWAKSSRMAQPSLSRRAWPSALPSHPRRRPRQMLPREDRHSGRSRRAGPAGAGLGRSALGLACWSADQKLVDLNPTP